jgi:hypothetical protein
MISIKNLFPLRYLGILPFLQERYQTRIVANPTRFSLELHTEGSLDTFPALFVKSGGDLRRDALMYLLLGKATDVVREKNGGLVLLSKDTDGFDNPPQALGATMLVAPDAVDYVIFDSLKRAVDGALASASDGAAVENGVRAAVDGVQLLVNGDTADPRFRIVVDAAHGALKLVRRQ